MTRDTQYWIGKRVQIPAYMDNWMRGDRYGEVTLAGIVSGRVLLRVKGDKGTVTRCWADDCEVIDSWGSAVLRAGAL